jgi:FKBP-type peptidyl-prolyl cis-trans isomerase
MDDTEAADEKARRDAANERELAEAQRIERERHEAREAEIARSWTKKVIVEGAGRAASAGLCARVHVTGKAAADPKVKSERAMSTGFKNGSVFEDSRERRVPLMLLLGRGVLVPGLDKALLTMCAGERAEVVCKPEAGYGAAGSVEHPCVPGSATLTYDVEMLSVDDEGQLWDLSFEEKMRLAEDRRLRGNTLVGGKYYLMAEEEYGAALRYLVFMPHPEPHQLAPIKEKLAAVHLNLAAVKLRMSRETDAIKHCHDCLEVDSEQPKAHYRLGQAYTQLGKVALATDHLSKAKALLGSADPSSSAAVDAELERLERRQARPLYDLVSISSVSRHDLLRLSSGSPQDLLRISSQPPNDLLVERLERRQEPQPPTSQSQPSPQPQSRARSVRSASGRER